jgi:hypothetical protein
MKITDLEAIVLLQPAVTEGIADGSQGDLVAVSGRPLPVQG